MMAKVIFAVLGLCTFTFCIVAEETAEQVATRHIEAKIQHTQIRMKHAETENMKLSYELEVEYWKCLLDTKEFKTRVYFAAGSVLRELEIKRAWTRDVEKRTDIEPEILKKTLADLGQLEKDWKVLKKYLDQQPRREDSREKEDQP